MKGIDYKADLISAANEAVIRSFMAEHPEVDSQANAAIIRDYFGNEQITPEGLEYAISNSQFTERLSLKSPGQLEHEAQTAAVRSAEEFQTQRGLDKEAIMRDLLDPKFNRPESISTRRQILLNKSLPELVLEHERVMTRRALRGKSKEELKADVRAASTIKPVEKYLPLDITRTRLHQMSVPEIRSLHSQYGEEVIKQRLAGNR